PVVLIGAGNMGGAMLSGWLKSGVPVSAVIVVDPGPSPAMLATISEAGATHLTALPTDLKASVLFLAVKPQVMEAVLPAVKSAVGPGTVVVSVAAGKTLGFLEKHLGKAAMVRAMP
ncbi:pyrroline-5-carboxylate reductase family protein, partial [Rhizobium ruizarguesonis]